MRPYSDNEQNQIFNLFLQMDNFFEMCEPPGNQKCQGEKLNQKYNDISQSMNKNRLWNLKICFQIMCFFSEKNA